MVSVSFLPLSLGQMSTSTRPAAAGTTFPQWWKGLNPQEVPDSAEVSLGARTPVVEEQVLAWRLLKI